MTNPRDILSDIQTQKGKRVGDTCEWILSRQEFSAWGASKDSQFLQLIGSPGIGKTMMSTFLIEVLKRKVEKSPDKLFAYFLCDDKDEKRRTPTSMLRSLIWQLLLQKNELYRHIQSDFEKHKDNRVFESLFENFSALWRIFQEMLCDEDAGEVFILIDALDECDSSTRNALLYGLRELLQASPNPTAKFRILITCRPEIDDIKYELDGMGVSLRMDSSEVNTDLSNYIEDRVKDLAKRKKYAQHVKASIKEALESQAGGTFLWVSLMLKELEKALDFEVPRKLKHLPKGLNETYTRILDDNIPKERREDAKFLLVTMVAARRPLTKKEIAASFAFWKGGSLIRSRDHNGYMGILSSCSSIISLDDANNDDTGTVNFCHQSVKDFLLDGDSASRDAWYHTSPDASNLLMFEICWRYLSSDEFSSARVFFSRMNGTLLRAQREVLQPHMRQHCFLGYAFDEWVNHAKASYPALLKELTIEITKAPTFRDAWLLWAVAEGGGQEAVVELLLTTEGVDVKLKDQYGYTPLSLAAQNGYEAVVKLLLATEKVDVDSKSPYGYTSLSLAAENGHEAVVKLLLSTQKVNVNSRDSDGLTPLSRAAENGHEAVVKLLLATQMVNVDSKDALGQTPLSLAFKNGHKAVMVLLEGFRYG